MFNQDHKNDKVLSILKNSEVFFIMQFELLSGLINIYM